MKIISNLSLIICILLIVSGYVKCQTPGTASDMFNPYEYPYSYNDPRMTVVFPNNITSIIPNIPLTSSNQSIAYKLANFGPQFVSNHQSGDFVYKVVKGDPFIGFDGNACFLKNTTIDGTSINNKILFVKAGYCSNGIMSSMVTDMKSSGISVAALIIMNCSPAAPEFCNPGRIVMNAVTVAGTKWRVPTAMISWDEGQSLDMALSQSLDVTMVIPGTGNLTTTERQALVRLYTENGWEVKSLVSNTAAQPQKDAIQIKDLVNNNIDPCTNPQRVMIVNCKYGKIYSFTYTNNFVYGTFPSYLSNFTGLESIILFNQKMTGDITDLSLNPKLKNIQLFGNNFNSIAVFSTISNLEVLVLSKNPLRNLNIKLDVYATSLWLFMCASCSLGSLPPFPSNIQFIDLSKNSIAADMPNWSQYNSLASLNLAFNRFVSSNTTNLFNSPNLQQLSVQSNLLSGSVPVFSGQNMTQIDLSSNNFTGSLLFDTWKKFVNLKLLNVSDNNITGPFQFAQLTKLQYFYASRNIINPGSPIWYQCSGCATASNPKPSCCNNPFPVGASWFQLFYNFPQSILEIDLSYNNINGKWGSSYIGQRLTLQKLKLNNNAISSLPNDFWPSSSSAWQYVDLSNNALLGTLPSGTPPPNLNLMSFEGNPNFGYPSSNTTTLPTFVFQSNILLGSSAYQYSCPQLNGITNPLFVIKFDPSYYNFKGCICNRGLWGNAPICNNIPSFLSTSDATFTDESYSSKDIMSTINMNNVIKLTPGVDISWIVSPADPDIKSIQFSIIKYSEFDILSNDFADFPNKLTISAKCPPILAYDYKLRKCSCKSGTYFNYVKKQCEIVNLGVNPSNINDYFQLISNETDSVSQFKYNIINSFATVNFQSKKTSFKHFSLNYTLNYNCPDGYQYFDYYNGEYLISSKCEKLFQTSMGISIAVYAAASVISIVLIFVTAVVVKKRNTLIIKSSSFPFCFCMLVFMTILSMSSIFYAITPDVTDSVCHLRPWFTALPLCVILSALLVKADRIRKIFGSKELVVQAISNLELLKAMLVMLSGELAILLWFTIGKVSVAKLDIGTGSTAQLLVNSCTDASATWIGIQFAYICLFLVAGVVEAWSVRKVPSAFNEGPHIASCLLSLVVLLIILIPVQFLVGDNPNALSVIRGIGQVLVSAVMAFFLFGPKLYYIIEGKENDKTMTSIGSSKSSSSSSSSFSSTSSAPTIDNNKQFESSNVLSLIQAINTSLEQKIKSQTVEISSIESNMDKLKKLHQSNSDFYNLVQVINSIQSNLLKPVDIQN